MAHKQGHYLWLEGVMTNMLDNDSVNGIVSNYRDITERKESELQREKITLDLIERNRNLEQYAYIVSHNLRAPVANILGLSSLLELEGVSESDRQQSLNHLFNSTRRLDEVIRDLNMILQMRHNVHDKKEEVVFEDVVSDIRASIQGLVMKKKLEFKTHFNVKSISSVKSYIYSIFYNLITNSVKYKKAHGKLIICISSEPAGDRVRLSFRDNGMGIDLDAHGSNIFGLYKRFHIGHAEGKGMGLFMTKTQVESLGGKISVKSEVNEGTEFILEL
jgi:signal transduction histidine kinase